MKKRSSAKGKDFFIPQEAQPDIAGLIIKMQQQISFLEKKIDTLIGQSHVPEKTFQNRDFSHSHRQRDTRQDNNFRDRVLHKAICADCNKECQVPFRPSQDRPVYCKDCFSKRKTGSPFKENTGNKPWEEGKRKAKRPAVKRRKARG